MRTIVQVEIGSGIEVLGDVGRRTPDILIEFGNLLKIGSGKAEQRTVERRYLAVILSIEADRRIELRLFDYDVGQTAVFRLAADVDIQVIL